MSPRVMRLLIAFILAAVASAFGTPVFHYLVTNQSKMTGRQDLIWFGSSFVALFVLVWLMAGRQK